MKRHFYQRGTSLPETVIVMAVLMFLILGIIDFGRFLYTYSFVAQLARQGARWTIVRGTACTQLTICNANQSQVTTYVQSLSSGATLSSSLSATVTSSTCSGSAPFAPGCTVTVTVTYPFKFMFPFLPQSQMNLSSSSTMQQAN